MSLGTGIKKTMMVFMMTLFLGVAVLPAADAYGAAIQTEKQVTTQTTNTAATEDDGSMFLLMGGGLLIILFAVIAAVSSVSAAVVIAANMDIDGE